MNNKVRLYENMMAYFNVSEIKQICFVLEIDYENLPGAAKGDKIRELISYVERTNIMTDLSNTLTRMRSNVSWDASDHLNKAGLQELMDKHAETHFLKYFPESIHTDFETAEEAWIVGFSLVRNPYFQTIPDKLEKGHSVKVLIVHPDDPGLEIAIRRSYKPTNLKRKRSEITTTLIDLCAMKKSGAEKLNIRVIRFPLSYGAHVINPSSPDGKLYIKLYPYTASGQKPKFVLRATSGYWFEFFFRELNSLWEAGEVLDCQTIEN
jgi:hypothetical protein